MLNFNATPNSTSRQKWFKVPFINPSKIIQFFKDAYELDDHVQHTQKGQDKKDPFPSVGRSATDIK